MTFYEFATTNPILTFFLVCVVGEVVIQVAKAFGRHK